MSTVISFLLLLFLSNSQIVCDSLHLSLANGCILKDSEQVNIIYGETLELFCTGEDNRIMMTKYGEEDFGVITTIINQTTIRYYEEKPKLEKTTYFCDDVDRMETVSVKIVVDKLPETANFHCVVKNFEYLNCTWTSPNIFSNFSLYYKDSWSVSLLCRLDPRDSMTCIWDRRNPSIPYQANAPMLVFLMSTCNHISCANQTFSIKQDEVLKLDPPVLDYIPTGPRTADLLWILPNRYYERGLKIYHRINYWYSGMVSQANLSFQLDAEDCLYYNRLDEERTCQYKLKLPCADTFYEIRMSIKSVRAVGEEYWSDEAVISFVTKPESGNVHKEVHPTCNHQRVKIIPEVMLYVIDQLKGQMIEKNADLKDKIRLLQLKRKEIKKPRAAIDLV